jgi:hypothetical protein
VAVSVSAAWLYLGAGGSVLILMLFHTMSNTAGGGYFSPMFTGADSARHSWLLAGLYVLVAAVLVALLGPGLSARRSAALDRPTAGDRGPERVQAE